MTHDTATDGRTDGCGERDERACDRVALRGGCGSSVRVCARARARARRPVTAGLVLLFRSFQVGFVTFFSLSAATARSR